MGKNPLNAYCETLDCVTAIQPGINIKTFTTVALALGVPMAEVQAMVMETGGEDIPQAYRWVPGDPQEEHCNIVGAYYAHYICVVSVL